MERLLGLFGRSSPVYHPRAAEIAAIQTPLAVRPFLPDNVDITVFYGGHESKKDFTALKPYLKATDMFVPELPLWSRELIEMFSRNSQGDRSARMQFEVEFGHGRTISPFNDQELKALLGTGIYITVIDYSAEDERADEIQNHFNNWGLLDKVVPSWQGTLDNIIAFARREAELEEYRENLIVASAGSRLQTLIDLDPTLSQKERVKVLIQQGAAHAFSYHLLEAMATKANSTSIRQVFGERGGMVYEHFDRLTHTFRTDVQVSLALRRELATRALARTALRFNAIPLALYASDRYGWRFRLPPPEEMVDRFSIADIKRFHQEFVNAKFNRK